MLDCIRATYELTVEPKTYFLYRHIGFPYKPFNSPGTQLFTLFLFSLRCEMS